MTEALKAIRTVLERILTATVYILRRLKIMAKTQADLVAAQQATTTAIQGLNQSVSNLADRVAKLEAPVDLSAQVDQETAIAAGIATAQAALDAIAPAPVAAPTPAPAPVDAPATPGTVVNATAGDAVQATGQ